MQSGLLKTGNAKESSTAPDQGQMDQDTRQQVLDAEEKDSVFPFSVATAIEDRRAIIGDGR